LVKKKLAVVLTVALALTVLTSCKKEDASSTDPASAWNVSYFNTDFFVGEFPDLIKVTTSDELSAYHEEIFEKPTSDENEEFAPYKTIEAVFLNDEEYNDEFFENNFLIFISTIEARAFVRHNIAELVKENDVLKIHAQRHLPEDIENTMEEWVIVIRANKSLLEDKIEVVWIDMDMDVSMLSPPVSELSSITINKVEGVMNSVVFTFDGTHDMFSLEASQDWKLTRDGNELSYSEWGIWGISHTFHREQLDGQTAFYVPFSLFSEQLAGEYVFSCIYLDKPVEAEPITIE
jgi:hypothetical protein